MMITNEPLKGSHAFDTTEILYYIHGDMGVLSSMFGKPPVLGVHKDMDISM